MLSIIDNHTDPYWNLAAEEYLLGRFDCPVFRLWQNAPAVIVGRNQNARAEINQEYIDSHGIAVVRRLSGGGAVYHDLGNVNYTFLDARSRKESSAEMFARFTAPVIAALAKLGVEAKLEGRNDLTIDGAKFSGNAIYVSSGRMMHHGTMLFDTSMDEMAAALSADTSKFTSKAVESRRSRVTNILPHLPKPMTAAEFIAFIGQEISAEAEPYTYTQEDIQAIDLLAERKYRRAEWNFAAGPAYSYVKTAKFPCGTITLTAKIEKGIIEGLAITGDYFFTLNTREFCEAMRGCPLSKEKIAERASDLPFGDYFNGITLEELCSLFII
ncbi:MAG: lipoate--protein ligase [Bacteroidales bacterium]|nr:lipoate--protein ligase [Bacteroidales bacterium]